MSDKERYLIVSLGSIGRRHLRNLRQIKPEAEIAVWRQHHAVNESELPEGADHLIGGLDEVLDFAPQAAIIAGPASRHLEAARSLADAGIHLFVEKPFADSTKGLNQLMASCRERRLTLMVGYNLRFFPSLMQVKKMLDDDVIGRVISVRAEVGQYLPDWRPAADYRQGVTARSSLGGGVLLELSHEIDYVYWMFGMPDRVTACGGRLSDLETDVEDTVELMFEYQAPKRLVNIHLDMVQRAPVRRCRIAGEQGTLIWDAMADVIEHYAADTRQWQRLEEYALADRNQMYIDELSEFLSAIAEKRDPAISGEQGKDVLAIVEAARKSIDTRTTIEMKNHV